MDARAPLPLLSADRRQDEGGRWGDKKWETGVEVLGDVEIYGFFCYFNFYFIDTMQESHVCNTALRVTFQLRTIQKTPRFDDTG